MEITIKGMPEEISALAEAMQKRIQDTKIPDTITAQGLAQKIFTDELTPICGDKLISYDVRF